MIRDASLINQIQLAIIGIVLVGGLFYIWRATCRIEDKLDILVNKVHTMSMASRLASAPVQQDVNADHGSQDAEDFMKHVFGGDDGENGAPFMMFIPNGVQPEDTTVKPDVVEVTESAPEEEHDQESEADTEAMNPLSKSKLKRMNVDTLKDLCHERGMPTDGSKNVLINRLLGISRE